MSLLTKSQKHDILRSIVDSDEMLWCSGTVNYVSDTLPLFYKSGGRGGESAAGWLDLLSATNSDLESLSKACEPATFGMDQQNVLDESYRKAQKLDLENFALNFSPEQLGFVDIIRKSLLTASEKDILFEKYKINVYGEGSFFKPHKDTPRSQSMFGSLVIVFPTPHEGGALLVSHNGRSSTIDFANLLKNQSANTVAYAAFYGDVDHEVSVVKSGFRVSLTYNLYYTHDDGNSETETSLNKLVHASANTSYEYAYTKFQAALSRLLQDPTFLPNGGMLCFRLRHEYAIPTGATREIWRRYKPEEENLKPLEPLKKLLKGSDAVICNVCAHLGLTTTLKFVYNHLDSGYAYFDAEPEYFLSDYGLKFDDVPGGEENFVYKGLKAKCIEVDHKKDFTWIRRKLPKDAKDGTIFKSAHIAYGNEAVLSFIYSKVSLVVSVGPQDKRDGFEMYMEKKSEV